MALPIIVPLQLAAASATAVCASQSPGAAGAMTINGGSASGGVATLDVARRVLFTFAADETGHSFVLTGKDRAGNTQSETIAGTTAGTVTSVRDYKSVTGITISAASTGAITVGTNGVGSSRWVPIECQIVPVHVGIGVVISGTVNYTVEYTYDDIQSLTAAPTAWSLTALASKSANTDAPGAITGPVRAWRLTMNSGTGLATATAIQGGIML